ncbi:MAG: LuxR C-terminal-related transcriptional regulator [Terriglobales bacterium]|jgi:DNA-binding NarL/FixJ family response regulator
MDRPGIRYPSQALNGVGFLPPCSFSSKVFFDALLSDAQSAKQGNFRTIIVVELERSHTTLGREAEIQALRDCHASLTSREREVMALVVSGLLNKQVGGELGISEITVKAHRGQVMKKMKADSLADLVRMAARLRLAAAPKG